MNVKLWPMELCTKIEEHNRKMIDTEEFLEAMGIKSPSKRRFLDVTTSNGPADWIQKEIRDSLAMAETLIPESMKKEMYESIKSDGFIDEMKVWKKRDVLDALTGVSTVATTAAKNLNNTVLSPEALNWAERRREEIEKENNMFITDPTNDSQRYYDSIKNYLRVKSMSMTHSPDAYPEIEIHGYAPQNVLCNTMKKEYDKMYKSAPKMPKATGIIKRGRATIVTWDDKTKTTIVLEEGREDLDMFHVFCIAFTKKMMGGTTNIMKTIEENDTDKINRERAEAIEKAEREAAEEARKEREAMERKQFEEDVRLEMYDHRVREEAIRRIMLKEGADIRKTEKIIDRFIEE